MTTEAHHLLAQPGDRHTVCGLDTHTKAAMPYLLARFVPMHREGHQRAGRPFTVCQECELRADQLDSGAYV